MKFIFLVTLLFLSYAVCVSPTNPNRIPRLSPFKRTKTSSKHPQHVVLNDFKTYFYDQTIDHFNYNPQSYNKFQQRYVINEKYWGGRGGDNISAPIFAYLGAESPIDNELSFIGFLTDTGPLFKSLIVYIEHRFYGESIPFGSMDEAMKNNVTRGYFNSAQTLADYAEVLLHVKQKYSAHSSPIIVVGGSYGGMLATWFRLKYPHVALGALASSAPILYFDDITPQSGYYSIVTKDFRDVSENCYDTIRKSWSEIDKVSAKPNGLSILSHIFRTCSPLKTAAELKDYLDSIYASAAQYNSPPDYPVNILCRGIDHPGGEDTSILARIVSGMDAERGSNRTCYNTQRNNMPSETETGWTWQVCSEMVIPIGRSSNDTMFPAAPFDLDRYIESCKDLFGVPPRPHWVTTYYGGHDIKLILKRFGSNIIFSNGLRDPYSSGGVLENLSTTLVAIRTTKGSHCLDIGRGRKDDPSWLVEQRNKEIKIIRGWLTKYYVDLAALKSF